MFASALVLVAMSVAVTSCKKDKDKEPDNCTCYWSDGEKEVFTPKEMKEIGLTCAEMNEEATYWDEGYCK